MPYSRYLASYFHSRQRGLILAIMILIGLVYLPFLSSPFFFDDQPFFWAGIPEHFAQFHLQLRYFAYSSIWWTWHTLLDAPPAFRLENALIHAVNVLLLFYLVRLLLNRTAPHQTQPYAEWAAWLAAAWFACHPVSVYAVGYVVQRSILMATLFTLAMQLAYLQGLLHGKKRWLALSVLFYFLAVFSKEHSVMAPAVLFASSLLFRTEIRAKLSTSSWALALTWLAYAVIAVTVMLVAKGVVGAVYEIDAPTLFEQQGITASGLTLQLLSAATQAGLFFKYLALWWLPNPAWMSIDMRESFISTLSSWQVWLNLAAFMAYGAFAGWLLLKRHGSKRLNLVGFALLYPWLFFIMEFSTVRVQEPFVLYRSYLWLPGMLLLIPIALQAINKKSVYIAFTLLTLLLIPLSWNRLWVFADSYRLWNDAAILLKNDHVAGAARIFYNRGNAELGNKQWAEALADFGKVITINPNIAQAQLNLGIAYFGLADYQHAINAFDHALSLKPDYAYAYYGKAISLKRLHQDDAAISLMQQSCNYGNTTACAIVSSVSKK